MQILNGLDSMQRQLFVAVFNDLSFELDEMGYREFPDDLIYDLLRDRFYIDMTCEKQLNILTQCIIKNQGKLDKIGTYYKFVS